MTRLRSCWLFLAFCLVALVLAVPLAGQNLPTAKPEEVGVCPEKVQELSTFMQSLVDQGQIAGGVTMMARHGKVVHLEAVGMADREEKKPMRTDSIFRIASMTKPITSVAIMMLWEQGKLGLDDPVSKYIPEFKGTQVLVSVEPLKTEPAKREITIRHLLTHTSGLGYEWTETLGPIYQKHEIYCGACTTDVTLDQMMRKLAGLPLLFTPGDRFEYGMNTDVLGRVIEVVSGVRLDRFIEHQICRPLRMNDTSFRVPPDKLERLAVAYMPTEASVRRWKENEVLRWKLGAGVITMSSDFPYNESNRYLSGGGNLCSTPMDYMRFCQMLLNGGHLNGTRLLRTESVKMMTVNQVGDLRVGDGFGFGFGVMPDSNNVHEQLRSSYNWAGGWSTSFRISPRGDWIVITMTQLAWDDKATPAWFALYEKVAAEAIQN